jgi:hypothetical protein
MHTRICGGTGPHFAGDHDSLTEAGVQVCRLNLIQALARFKSWRTRRRPVDSEARPGVMIMTRTESKPESLSAAIRVTVTVVDSAWLVTWRLT